MGITNCTSTIIFENCYIEVVFSDVSVISHCLYDRCVPLEIVEYVVVTSYTESRRVKTVLNRTESY